MSSPGCSLEFGTSVDRCAGPVLQHVRSPSPFPLGNGYLLSESRIRVLLRTRAQPEDCGRGDMTTNLAAGTVIPFLRRKDYVLVKPLGRGACGETVLLRDDLIDGLLVCKKYAPSSELLKQELYANFLREIKLLHEVNHHNVVRVFNYFVYPDNHAGYILMEYIDGLNIEEHLRAQPEAINDVFRQALDGFAHLEQCSILHRDIRPGNLLVRQDGIVKIIDLGFGKRIQASTDYDKSISLNWWCEPPDEFSVDTYDQSTEVYFVGKLFEKLIQDLGIEEFKHPALLEKMCKRNPVERIDSFADATNELLIKRADDIDFSKEEHEAYLHFANAVISHVSKIKRGTKYTTDLDVIRAQLEVVYRNCMLEPQAPDCAPILRTILAGAFHYKTKGFQTWTLLAFLRLLRSAPVEKQRVVFANLHTRLDAVPRYEDFDFDDDIPF